MPIIVSEEIEEYALARTSDPGPLLNELAAERLKRYPGDTRMSGPTVGYFLNTLVHMSGARRVLEIGTFVGYSALMIASALPEDGELITCDVDPEATSMARRYWDRHPAGNKIDLRLAPALETLAELDGPFDLIFIDADKGNYAAYYEKSLGLLAERGVIVIDNVLWYGNVLAPLDDSARSIVSLNDIVAADGRVKHVLLTVRDGLMLIRRA